MAFWNWRLRRRERGPQAQTSTNSIPRILTTLYFTQNLYFLFCYWFSSKAHPYSQNVFRFTRASKMAAVPRRNGRYGAWARLSGRKASCPSRKSWPFPFCYNCFEKPPPSIEEDCPISSIFYCSFKGTFCHFGFVSTNLTTSSDPFSSKMTDFAGCAGDPESRLYSFSTLISFRFTSY